VEQAVTKPLYDPEWGLTGKPDYLVATAAGPLPVEVKSRRAGPAPYDGHRLQVAAYCRLVEVTTGQRPAYGILRYADRTFAIDYTPALEAELRQALADLRACDRQKEVARSHDQPARCAHCGYRAICPEKV
jgi:CRISPR-associated exonuclease Cas4